MTTRLDWNKPEFTHYRWRRAFKSSFKHQPINIKQDFARKIEIFKLYPFYPSLHTHKLSGDLGEYYGFYLRDGFRVIFIFMEDDNILLVNIGSHDDYKKWGR